MEYGITIYQGMFGKGKTYYTFSQLYRAIYSNGHNPYVIANIPYSIVDMFFSSVEDLKNIIQLITDRIQETNKDYQNYDQENQRPIIIIIDEGHLYFSARDWAKGDMQIMMAALTQCRKRKIKFIVITQKPGLIDKTFRVLSDYTIKLDTVNFLGVLSITKSRVYLNPGDILDIDTDSITINSEDELISRRTAALLVDSHIFFAMSDWLELINRYQSRYRFIQNEKYNTFYVTGLQDHQRRLVDADYYPRDWSGYDDRQRQLFTTPTQGTQQSLVHPQTPELPKLFGGTLKT